MKGLTIFLCCLAIASAGLAGWFYSMVGNEKVSLADQLALTEKQLVQARQRLAEFSSERESATTRVLALEAELNELKARNISLEARNNQLSREIVQTRESASGRDEPDPATTRQIAELTKQLEQARALARAQAGGATAEQVAAFEARIAELEQQLATLHQTIPPDGADPLAGVPEDLTANVIDIGPRASFVILDIGSRHGAVPSLEMVLRRGSIVVARVRLTDVKETYSVAHVLPRTGAGGIRPGDTASRS